jgi:hypothetical protein
MLKKFLFTLLCISGLSFCFVELSSASSTSYTQSIARINKGTLKISAPQANVLLKTITVDGTIQQAKAKFSGPLNVTDNTGTGAGWHVTVKASPFKELNPGGEKLSLPTGSLALSGIHIIDPLTNNTKTPSNISAFYQTIDGSSVTIISAKEKEGMGGWNFTFANPSLILSVDTSKRVIDNTLNSKSTSYSSNITWNLISGP